MRKRLFRYSAKKYNDLLLNQGSLRIGTLHDFRRDDHKTGIADGREGKKTVSHYIDYYNPMAETSIPSMNARALSELVGGMIQGTGTISNITFARSFEEPDCYIHCTATELSSDVMAQFEGADSCVEIFDVRHFYRALSKAVKKHCDYMQILQRPIVYQAKDEQWNGRNLGMHPSFIKEEAFKAQCEYRVIWVPPTFDPIEPLIITAPELAKYCRAVEL